MDFGVDRLVDMIEDRFGRRAANALLALVVVAVSGYCINLIYRFIVSPITWGVTNGFGHVSNGDITISKWQIVNWIIGFCITVALLTIYWSIAIVINTRIRRSAKSIISEAKSHSELLKIQFSELQELQNSVKDEHQRIDEFFKFIKPSLTENGIDVDLIMKKLKEEKSGIS